MSLTNLVLVELAASALVVLVIVATLRHACDPRRDRHLDVLDDPSIGRHRADQPTPARHAAGVPAAYLVEHTRETDTGVLIDLGLIPAHTGGTR